MDENKDKNSVLPNNEQTPREESENWRKQLNLPPMGEKYVTDNVAAYMETRQENKVTFKGKEL